MSGTLMYGGGGTGGSSGGGAGGVAGGTPVGATATQLLLQQQKQRKSKRLELSEDQRHEIREAFDLFDAEKTGKIGFHELKVCLRAFGFDVKKKDMQELRRDYDQKQTGYIDFIDFQEILGRRISERDPINEIKKAFKLFDDDNTGKISLKNLKRVARELGENLNEDELQAMIDEFDEDGDGQIAESEFINIMTQSALF